MGSIQSVQRGLGNATGIKCLRCKNLDILEEDFYTLSQVDPSLTIPRSIRLPCSSVRSLQSSIKSTERQETITMPKEPCDTSSRERENPTARTTSPASSEPHGLMPSPSTLELKNYLDEIGAFEAHVVHIETTNTSYDNPYGKPIDFFYEGVHDGKILGSGISGVVREVKHRTTGHRKAVKCLDLDRIGTEDGLKQLREEIYIMCQLDHPSIVRLEEVYEAPNEIYMVEELCTGGELYDRLEDQEDYHYSEGVCARLVKQMLNSVRYLHSKGIVHRDLKLENFLFSTTDPKSELKMIDFGLSKHFSYKGEVQTEAVGTPYTVAPEVLKGGYDERCDLWAIGVITYLLLSGETPFGGCGGPEPLMTIRYNILRGQYSFEPDYIWENVSDLAKDFIAKMLKTDPNERIASAEDAQHHPWFESQSTKIEDMRLNPEVVESLVSFKEYGDMRKLLCEVLSFTLMPDQIQDLRVEFEKLDEDGSGEITLETLKRVLMTNAHAGSLGALNEEEVEDIFNAMRVKKSETTIHWHEFIAACLSMCKVDDCNLKLAFDRMDSDHKGYINLDNVLSLMGKIGEAEKEEIRRMYQDGLDLCSLKNSSNQSGLSYADFKLLMKGQTKACKNAKPTRKRSNSCTHCRTNSNASQLPNLENDRPFTMDSSEDEIENKAMLLPQKESTMCIGRRLLEEKASQGGLNIHESENQHSQIISCETEIDTQVPNSLLLTSDDDHSFDNQEMHTIFPVSNSIHTITLRHLSVNLPEHEHDNEDIENLLSTHTLATNRELYRAHRQMRLSVLEASKRFEEKHNILKEKLRISKIKNENQGVEKPRKRTAGLVMRNTSLTQSSNTMPVALEDDQMEEISTSHATAPNPREGRERSSSMHRRSRGGRGRRQRERTTSDISGMFNATPPSTKGNMSCLDSLKDTE